MHKHRDCGVLAPNAKLRRAVTATVGPAGATLQILREAREKMGLEVAEAADTGPWPLSSDEGESRSLPGRIAGHCWAFLLARIFEYLPLVCPRCGAPMRLIAFIVDPPQVERILAHIGEPVQAPAVLSARSPPQGELSFGLVDGENGQEAWPEIDQTGGGRDDSWE